MPLHPEIDRVTDRIRERSAATRAAYLKRAELARRGKPQRGNLSCSNLAHGFAACGTSDKDTLAETQSINVGIVSAYNDMLSAHQPLEALPAQIKQAVATVGAVAQFAGGVPAMCDGVTQGQPGMELSLFSRDVIAQATAVALSHNMFDSALCLGVCDKIVPGLLIGALAFGQLPVIFVPAGPMHSGLSNDDKRRIRERYAAGEISQRELLEAESAAYHSPGTCTFYGTANSNQMLMEMMGLHIPGATFAQPDSELRQAATIESALTATRISDLGDDYRPISQIIDERAIVNGLAGLMATGGSTNHTLHLIAIARAAGILINWDDFETVSKAVPLLARVYPNGSADVNHFDAAGGINLVLRELLDKGLVHGDAKTVYGSDGLAGYTCRATVTNEAFATTSLPDQSADSSILRSANDPFQADGGLRLLEGNLGRCVIKTSAVKPEHWVVEAPARVFESQRAFHDAFKAGDLNEDFIAVVRFQGPKANGMPELHKLTPYLALLQSAGRKVALVTDGRMSGASGKVPAAIHLTPEALGGGAIGRVQDGDPMILDAQAGRLAVLVDQAEFDQREPAGADLGDNTVLMGRELFEPFRAMVGPAEEGASIFGAPPLHVPDTVDLDGGYEFPPETVS
ncbi:MAG: phosphogluconate dehydratase [Gammaproteobacteria bacterium]